ncbi:uncharacterized protein H6S33_008088 [Morchella sextelata]|uniref:uncharacterized protein n=1 Tax=Morchella sextelata TaxID=1174677 RepID=UPI001D04E132|nr:uncharacterized protein H6S33_008088 [Morchella sextelata]KAH0603084.1 hypothetical protein H6S33_008088 [Morchella sextelata]
MNFQPISLLASTPELQFCGPSSTFYRISYITGRLIEVRKLIDIHQDDLPTRWATYEEHLKHYHRARLSRFIASCGKHEERSSTAVWVTTTLSDLTTKEASLKDLVKMLHDNYQWMAEKVSLLQKEERRLVEELEIDHIRMERDGLFTSDISWKAEVFIRKADGSKVTMDGLDASDNIFQPEQ